MTFLGGADQLSPKPGDNDFSGGRPAEIMTFPGLGCLVDPVTFNGPWPMD